MKIVVFGPERRTGVLQDGMVVDVSRAHAKFLYEQKGMLHAEQLAATQVPFDLARLIEAGPAALDSARQALEYLEHRATDREGLNGTTLFHAVGDLQLHAPHPRAGRVACAGSNFVTHRQRMAKRAGREERQPFIWGFWKIARDTVGPEGEVRYPRRCNRLDYEGEVAIVLGKQGKNLRSGQLGEHVWGVTLANDWSIRGPRETLGPMNFAPAKNFDTSLSLGPCIVVGDIDPGDVEFETWVNGERRQHNNTSEMVFSFGEYLEYLSRDLTLHPGDLICSGTGQGTVADSIVSEEAADGESRFLQPGDLVEVRSTAIGTLRSRIVREGV